MQHEHKEGEEREELVKEELTKEKLVKEEQSGSISIDPESSASGSALQKPKRDMILPISIVAASLMVAGALVFATLYKGGAGNGAAGAAVANVPAATGPSASTTAAILALGPRDAILGNPNAPVTVIEYGDYQCPFCADYFQKLEPVLKQDYINTGKVRMVFRDLPFLGSESQAAAEAAQCAEDQNALWVYHDALYTAKLANDAKNGGENDGFFTRALFMGIASQLHLNTTQFGSCLDTHKDAQYVAQEKAGGVELIGGASTPTTFVNGVLVADANGQGVGDNQPAVLQMIGAAVAAAK